MLSALVVPVMLDKTTERGTFDFVHPYLREIWAAIIGVYALGLCWWQRGYLMEARANYRGFWSYAIVGALGLLCACAVWWVTGLVLEKDKPKPAGLKASQQEEVQATAPSLLFVFGAPLGDNESTSWIMMLKHYGPNSAHNCDIQFYDNDRKNIEHEWLVKHPNSPFPRS